MANEFKVKKGLVVNGSGSVILDVQGSQGQLFSVTDNLSGSLFSVNDISGMPVLQVSSDDSVRLGTYALEGLIVSGSTATARILNTSGSIVASGGLARPVYLNNVISASANNDVLVGLDISSSFSTGSYTGVTNLGLRLNNTGFQLNYGATGITTFNIVNTNSFAFTNRTGTTSVGTAGSAAWGIYDGSRFNGFFGHGGTNANLGISVGGAQVGTWFATGNLFIGASPTDAGYKLDVNGTARFVGNTVLYQNTAGSAGTGYAIEFATNASAPRADFVVNGVYTGQFSAVGNDINFKNSLSNSGTINFNTKISGVDDTRLKIFNTGNVVIQSGGTFTDAGFKLDVSGSVRFTNNLTVTGSITSPSITGSLLGTASYATQALTASYALNATTASYSLNTTSASYASTSSYATDFLVAGTITAQKLVVQTVSSSVVYSSGSNTFGNDLSNTQVLTGSVSVTGSLSVNGSSVMLSNQTSSMSVLSASYAGSSTSASYAPNFYNSDGTLNGNRTVTSNGYSLTFTGVNTASASIGRGMLINHTISASANNDVLVGLDVAPTFSTASYTGVTNVGLRVQNSSLSSRTINIGTNSGQPDSKGFFFAEQGSGSFVTDVWVRPSGNGASFGYSGLRLTTDGYTHAIKSSLYAQLQVVGGQSEGTGLVLAGGLGSSVSIGTGLAPTNQLVVSTSGNTLVGTATDAGYKLDVSGTSRHQGLTGFNSLSAVSGTPTTTPSTTGGTLADGTYYYKIVAYDMLGNTTTASTEVSASVSGGSGSGSVALSWNGVGYSTGYRIYQGTTSNGQNKYFTSTNPSFTDTGSAGTAGTVPTANSTVVSYINTSNQLILGAYASGQVSGGGFQITPSSTAGGISFNSQGAFGRIWSNPQSIVYNTYDQPTSVGFVGTNGFHNVWYGTMSPSGGGVRYNASSNGTNRDHIWYFNFNEQMRLFSNGNLGINASGSDASYKLYVSGSGASGSLNINNLLYVSSSVVGINTTGSSAYSLDVSGSARVQGNAIIQSAAPEIRLVGNTTNVGTKGLYFYHSSRTAWVESTPLGGSDTGNLVLGAFGQTFLTALGTSTGPTAVSISVPVISPEYTGNSTNSGTHYYSFNISEKALRIASTRLGSFGRQNFKTMLRTDLSGVDAADSDTFFFVPGTNRNVSINSATTDLGYALGVSGSFGVLGSITASGAIARGVYFNNTLSASANNDVLVGLDINPTFSTGSFTGVGNYGIRMNNGSGIAFTSTNTQVIKARTGGLQFDFSGGVSNYWNSDGQIQPSSINTNGFSAGVTTAVATLSNGAGGAQLILNASSTSNAARIQYQQVTSAKWYGGINSNSDFSITTDGGAGVNGLGIFYSTKNVVIGTNTDSGFKLDVSGSVRFSNNLTVTGSIIATSFTGSLSGTASYSLNTTSASYAATSSYANDFIVAGTITAQKLVVQTVTSSVVYSSGSNIFGNSLSNTQTFTGSVNITGSTHTIYGNVGIGTTNPLAKFEVASASSTGSVGFNIGTSSSPERGNLFYYTDGTGWKFNIGKYSGSVFTPQMSFNDNGNIGIGTTAPGANLVVQNTSGTSIPSLGTSGGHFQLQNGSYGLLAGVATSGNAWMQVGRTDSTATAYNLLLQPNGGNILVGTATDAGYKLDVNGTGRFSGNATINGTIIGTDATYGTPYRTFAFGTNSDGYNRIWGTTDTTDGLFFSAATGRGFNFRPNGGTTNTFTIASTGAATFSSNITTATANQFNIPNGVYNASFYSSEVATTGYNVVRINAAFTSAIGYYGIGGSSTANTSFRDAFVVGTQNAYDLNFNTNDTKRVNINGSTGAATFSSAVYASQFSGNTYPYNSIFGNGTDASYSILYAGSTNSYVSSVTVNGGGTGTPNTIIMQTASTERMRITSGGNLLINTTTDAGYKLQVNGTSRFYDSVRVDATSSSGYGLSAVGSSGGARQIFLAGQVGYSNGFTVDYNGTNMAYQMLNGNLTVGGAVIAGTATSTIGSIILQGAYSAGALTNIGSMYSSGGPVLGYAVTPSTSADESFLSATNVTIARGAYYIQGGAHIWYAGSSQSVAIGSAVSMSERMRIASNGNVLIGTSTDTGVKLNVNGTIGLSGYTFAANSGNYNILYTQYGAAGIYLGGAGDPGNYYDNTNHYFRSIYGGTNFLIVNSSGATFSASVTATAFYESSDATLKTLITDNYLVDGIENVAAKLYIKNNKQEIGYFAQDVQPLLPSSVTANDAGILSLSYTQVHTAKIASLEQRVKQLEERLKQYEA